MSEIRGKILFQGDSIKTVIIADFNSNKDAEDSRAALEGLFEDVENEIRDLFQRQGGEAHVSDIADIYAKHGLRNEIGWEQTYPLLSHGSNLAWALPPGVHVDDAKNLLLQMGAVDIIVHNQDEEQDWSFVPHPLITPMDDEDVDEDTDFADDDLTFSFYDTKRTLH